MYKSNHRIEYFLTRIRSFIICSLWIFNVVIVFRIWPHTERQSVRHSCILSLVSHSTYHVWMKMFLWVEVWSRQKTFNFTQSSLAYSWNYCVLLYVFICIQLKLLCSLVCLHLFQLIVLASDTLKFTRRLGDKGFRPHRTQIPLEPSHSE